MFKKDKKLLGLLVKFLLIKNKTSINLIMMSFVSIVAALSKNVYGNLSIILHLSLLGVIVFTATLSMVYFYFYDNGIFQDIISERGMTFKIVNMTLLGNAILVFLLTSPSIMIRYWSVTRDIYVLAMTLLIVTLLSGVFSMTAMVVIFKMKDIPYRESLCNISLIIYYFMVVGLCAFLINSIEGFRKAMFVVLCILIVKSVVVVRVYLKTIHAIPRKINGIS